MHLRASSAKMLQSPRRRSGGFKRTTSAESHTGSMADDAEADTDAGEAVDPAVAKAEEQAEDSAARQSDAQAAYKPAVAPPRGNEASSSENPAQAGATVVGTAKTDESDSAVTASSARSDEAQGGDKMASSGITNPRAQVSRILNYVT